MFQYISTNVRIFEIIKNSATTVIGNGFQEVNVKQVERINTELVFCFSFYTSGIGNQLNHRRGGGVRKDRKGDRARKAAE